MTLTEIEKTFGFAYPTIYKQLEQDKMLNVGQYGPNWYKTIFPTLKDNPTLLLHSNEFELLSTGEISDEIASLATVNNTNPQYQLIPFGLNGAGDSYCFYITKLDKNDIPIVMFFHDSDEVIYLAKNLQDYIFKKILEDMAEQDTYNSISDKEFKDNIASMLKTHSVYLTAVQNDVLHELITREISDFERALPKGRKEIIRGLLPKTELEKLILQYISFEKMGQTFEYSIPITVEEEILLSSRIIGTITLRLQPIPAPQDKIHSHLKELNWRQKKLEHPNCIEYFRKQIVFFGTPTFADMEDHFKTKLTAIKNVLPTIEIEFQENDSDRVYKL